MYNKFKAYIHLYIYIKCFYWCWYKTYFGSVSSPRYNAASTSLKHIQTIFIYIYWLQVQLINHPCSIHWMLSKKF